MQTANTYIVYFIVRHYSKDCLYWLRWLILTISHFTHFSNKKPKHRHWGLVQVQISSKWQGQNSSSGSLALEFVALNHYATLCLLKFYVLWEKTNKSLENTQGSTVRLLLRPAINEWLPKSLIPKNFPPKKPMMTYPRTCSLHSGDLKTSHNFIIPSQPKVFCVRFIFISFWLLLRAEERSWQQREVKPQYSSLQGRETSDKVNFIPWQKASKLKRSLS